MCFSILIDFRYTRSKSNAEQKKSEQQGLNFYVAFRRSRNKVFSRLHTLCVVHDEH